MTLQEHASAGAERIRAAGVAPDEARRDATMLARAVLGWDATEWITRSAEEAPHGFAGEFESRVARRTRREPMAYILRAREFYGRAFVVTPEVLIPRHETELVVDEALECLSRMPAAVPLIADLGTGSGCLAVTLALECPRARVLATDVSFDALGVATRNAGTLGALDRVTFHLGGWLAGITEPLDLIVSNPPYVPERDRASIAPEVREYEPASALFAGDDGLDAIRTLVPAAAGALRPGGWLVMEIGAGQADEVRHLIEDAPRLRLQRIAEDLQHIPRVVVATAAK
jgi:release factor glutamine methyltransferase